MFGGGEVDEEGCQAQEEMSVVNFASNIFDDLQEPTSLR